MALFLSTEKSTDQRRRTLLFKKRKYSFMELQESSRLFLEADKDTLVVVYRSKQYCSLVPTFCLDGKDTYGITKISRLPCCWSLISHVLYLSDEIERAGIVVFPAFVARAV